MNVAKIHRKLLITESQFYFAYISAMEARIFMKFYMVVKFYLENLSFKFHEDWCINARAQVVSEGTHVFIASVRVYDSCARIYARIFIKFKTIALKIVFDHHINFHEDPNFRCGDIGKVKLTFCNQ